jgi:hypothetical protein
MHVIYRKNIARNFRYTTNIYNQRYGCDDEEAKNKNTLELYINKIKMYYVTQHVKPGTRFYLDIANASLGYFALVIAIAELRCIITNDPTAQISIDRIVLDELLKYSITDSKKCTSVNKQVPERHLPLYEKDLITYSHEQCFTASRDSFDDIGGDVLLVSNNRLIDNFFTVCQYLCNSKITNRLALGYNDFEEAKHKIIHAIIHHNIDQIFLPAEIQNEIKIDLKNTYENLKITYFSY